MTDNFNPATYGAQKVTPTFNPEKYGAVKVVRKETKAPEPQKSGWEKVADFFAKTTSDTFSSASKGLQHKRTVSDVNERITQLQQQNREIIERAKASNNPAEKAALLEQSRQISAQVAGAADEINQSEKQLMLSGDITEKDISRGGTEFALRRGVGTALETGAALLPGTKEMQGLLKVGVGAKGLERAVRGATAGAVTGALGAGSRAAVEAESIGQAAGQVGTGVTAGAAFGALTNWLLGKRPENAAKVIQEKQKTIYNDLANDNVISSRRTKDVFKQRFNIPDKVAKRINLDKSSEELAKHGVGGTLDDMIATADYVTGPDGKISNINRQVIKSLDASVDSNVALDAAKKALQEGTEIDSKEANKITKFIASRLKPAEKVGTTSAADAFDLVQDLEATGYQYLNSSTALSPNVANEQKGKVYLAAANALKDQIDQVSFDKSALDRFKTPEMIDSLKLVSNRLAEQFKNAKSVGDLRRIQAPWVTLKQAAQVTIDKQNTPFANVVSKSSGLNIGNLPFKVGEKVLTSPTGIQAQTAASSAVDRLTQSRVAELLKQLGLTAGQQYPRIKAEDAASRR